MTDNESHVNIEAVKRNAAAQGIVLQEIAIFYAGLTDAEKSLMQEQNLLKQDNGNIVIATFTNSGEALFPEKIKGVHYLGA